MLRNCWLKWFENRMQYRRLTGRSLGRRRRTLRHRPTAAFVGEALETRTLLTTYFVNTTVDVVDANDGLTSLREAITMAEADATADMIRFAPGLEGAVFNITQGPLPTITEDLQILGTIGNAQSINGAGLIVEASGAGDITTFAMNSVNINLAPTGAGLQINATADGVANVTVFNSRLTNAAAQGLNFVAHTGGVVNLRLVTVAVLSNGDVVQSEGIRGAVGVGTQAESLTTPGNFATANIDFRNVTVVNHNLEGFRLDVESGGIVTTPNPITNSSFSNNGFGNQRSGVRFHVSGAGSSLQADFASTVAHNATGAGYEFRALSGADLDVSLTGSASQGAKSDALNVTVDNASATIDVDGLTALNNGDNGVEFRLTNGAVVDVNTFNNVNINNALNTGLKIGVLSGSTLNAFNATNVTVNNSGGAGNTNDGSGVLLTTLGSVSNFNFTNLTSTNNLVRGVQIGVNQGGTSTKTFNNLIVSGNLLTHPIGIGVGNNSTLDTTINGGNLSSAAAVVGSNIVYMPVTGDSTSNLTIDGVTFNGSTSSGLVANYDGALTGGTIDIRNSSSTGNKAVGIALFVTNGADVDGNFENVNVSNAGQTTPSNGMRLEIDGVGSTGDFTFDGVNANGAAGTGISLVYNNGAAGSVNQFDNVTAQNTGGDGVLVNVRGFNTTLSNFAANGVNVTGAGLGTNQNSDGLDITVAGPGAVGTFNLQNVIANVAGGRGVKVQVENTATATVDVDGFSADGNGLEGVAIDVGTVVAGAQLLGSAFTNGTASNNGQAFMANRAGIRSNVRGTGSVAEIDFASVFANSNTDDGLSLTGEAGATLTVDLSSGVATLGNLANGVDFRGDGPTTTVALTSAIPGNLYTGNGGIGLNVLLTNQVTADQITVQGEASLNQGDGVRIADDGSGVTINSLQVSGNSQMNTNQGNGLAISLDGALGLTSLDLSSLTLSNNDGDQINVFLANMSLTDVLLDDITATGPGAGSGSGDGVELTLDGTAVTNSLALNRVTTTNNGEDGLELNFINGASIPMGSVIDIGTFNLNGQHGVNLAVTDATIELSMTNSLANMGAISSASSNAGRGLNVTLNNATLSMPQVDNQTFNLNGGSGVHIQAATPSDFISGNTFSNNEFSENGSFGFRAIFNSGNFDIALGEAGRGNLFSDNVGAAIAIDMIQDTLGQLSIEDNVIVGTSNAVGNAVFNGEAIFIRQLGTISPMEATSTLSAMGGPGLLIQNNRIGVNGMGAADGNAGFGITFQSEEASQILGLEILGNEISNNGLGGINFRRRDAVNVTGFIIDANLIEDNNGNGIGLLANNSALAGPMQVQIGRDTDGDSFQRSTNISGWLSTLNGNMIRGNASNGILLDVVTDSRINANLTENVIMDNSNGILMTETVLSGDTRAIFGTWTQNVVTNNRNRGIQSSASTSGLGVFVTDSIVGAVIDQFGQVISGMDGNGSTGIELNGAGVYGFNDVDIVRNGLSVQADRSQGHGIDIQGAGFKDVFVSNSLIRENFQDGVEILHVNNQIVFDLSFVNNRVVSNVGRGFDILKQGSGSLNINIGGTNDPRVSPGAALAQVNSNGEEGIYIVNTPSTTQNQTDFSYVALAQDGNPNSDPRSVLNVNNVTINFNGNDIGQEGNQLRPAGSGLVVRVGSSDAGAVNSVGDPGGFASNRGGVRMSVQSNYLEGNVGDGMFFHGYTATAATGTGNAWPNTGTINNSGYQNDPLARLDLIWGVFANNTQNVFAGGDQLNANNNSPTAALRGTPGGQAGAFYQTTDQNFKSRLNNTTTFPDNPGPFSINNRRRNAQRVGVRVYPDMTMLGPATNPGLVYPGMGDSTFRVSASSGNNADLPIASGLGGFNLDSPSPIQNPNNASGTSFTGAAGVARGELPFGWGTF